MTASLPADPLALARSLAQRIALKRAEADEKAYADAILAQLKDDRLLWAAAPKAKGGEGLSVADLARATFHIARLSGSAGLIYAMHMSQALSVIRHGGEAAYFAGLVDRLTRDQTLVASGTSEKGVGGDIFGSLCTVEAAPEGGLMVTKESPNISYLDHAGLVLISAQRPLPNGKTAQVLIAAETGRMELAPGRETGFIGMRGILNRPYAFTARFDEAAIFAEPYPVIARETMTPAIHILWAALWSGIARHALDKAKLFLAREAPPEDDASGIMRGELSRLVDKHYAMNALIRDAIAEFEQRSEAGAMGMAHTARVKRLKVVCSELLEQICHGALGLIGIRGYSEAGPYSLSEPLRDAMSARVMISNYRLLANNAKVERFIEEAP